MSEVVQKQVQDGVAILTLNRPERLNAWTTEMEHDYFGMLEECGNSAEVRVIVVTGAGRGFCAGADMQDLKELGDDGVDAGPRRAGAPAADVPAVDPQADHRRDQRRLRRDRPRAGADVRPALRRRRRQADDRLRPPRARRRARDRLDPAAPARPRAGARPAALRSRRARPGGAGARPRQPRARARALLEETLDYARELAASCSPTSMATIKRQVYADLQRELPDALSDADRLMLDSFTAPDFVEGVDQLPRAPRPALRLARRVA